MRLKLFGATVLSLGILAGACANAPTGSGPGDGGTGSGGSDTGTPTPVGSDQLVLRIEEVGGFVAVQYNLTRMPIMSLYADGLLITPGVQTDIYPGPALPASDAAATLARGGPAPDASGDRRGVEQRSRPPDHAGVRHADHGVHADHRRADPHDERLRARHGSEACARGDVAAGVPGSPGPRGVREEGHRPELAPRRLGDGSGHVRADGAPDLLGPVPARPLAHRTPHRVATHARRWISSATPSREHRVGCDAAPSPATTPPR